MSTNTGTNTGDSSTESTTDADTQNNNGDYDFDKDNIWDVPKPDATQASQNNGNNNAGQQQQQVNPDAQFDAMVNGLNFKPNFTPEHIQAFQRGDMAPLVDMMDALAKATYKRSMLDSMKAAQQISNQASDQAFRRSTGVMDSREAQSILERVVPIAKNGNVAPVARAAFQTFMQKGQNAEEAARSVQKYFDTVRGRPNSDFGLAPPAQNTRNRSGGSTGAASQDDSPQIDWLKFAKDN